MKLRRLENQKVGGSKHADRLTFPPSHFLALYLLIL